MPTRMKAERPEKPAKPVELQAGPGRCQEASPLSKERYIPCSAPAIYLVGWIGRPEKPIRMCELCASHNVDNRRGVIIRPLREEERVPDEPKPATAELVPSREYETVLPLITKIGAFISNLKPYFAQGRVIANDAADFAGSVSIMKPPKTAEEDAAIVRTLKIGKDKKEKAIQHWSLRKLFYDINVDMHTAEKEPVALLDKANATLQRFHNEWDEADRRRVYEEQRRVDDAARLEEQKRRDAEAARMEAEARKREEDAPGLSRAQEVFVDLYVTDQRDRGNAAACYTRAGYKGDAFIGASKLMSLAKVLLAITAKEEAIAIRRQAEAKRYEPVTLPSSTPVVERNVLKVGKDTVRWGGDVIDSDLFMDACGIPEEIVIRTPTGPVRIHRRVFEISEKEVNLLGRQLETRLDQIPGLRHRRMVSTT